MGQTAAGVVDPASRVGGASWSGPSRWGAAALVAAALAVFAGCAARQHGTDQRTCLVLSVGSARGFAHLGAIEVLKEKGVEIDCVVGNSMGALMGSLYAVDPKADTTESARRLLSEYVATTKSEATGRGTVGAVLGFLVAGPFGALAGGGAGAMSTEKLNHDRLIKVLDVHLGRAQMGETALPFVTSYLARKDDKVAMVEPTTGSVADAVGGSVANPFIFESYDVRREGVVDPGVDRMAAVPIEQACRQFPESHLIAINVTDGPAVAPLGFDCTVTEVMVDVQDIDPAKPFVDAALMEETIERGRAAVRAQVSLGFDVASKGSGGAVTATAEPRGPQPYVVQVVEAHLADTKPSGKPWDAEGYGPPDVFVSVTVEGAGAGKLTTKIVKDTFTPAWTEVQGMTIAKGDRLIIRVVDADALLNDLVVEFPVVFVGPQRYTLSLPKASLNGLVLDVQVGP